MTDCTDVREDELGIPTGDEALDMAQQEGWEPPVPLVCEEELPPFPLGNLPQSVADYASYVAAATQTAPEMAGVLSLGVLATLYQGRYELRLTNHWRETLSLYTLAIAPPAERKSAVLSLLTEPIRAFEAERAALDAAELAMRRARRDVAARRLEQLKARQAAGEEDDEEALGDAVEAVEELALSAPYRLLADDATSERLAGLLSEQGGRLTVCSAEGGIFDAMNGRYDSRPNLDVYLKAHDGDMLYVDRVGREGCCIQRPRLSMILAAQPEVVSALMRNRAMRGRGIAARFLYAVCKSRVGARSLVTEDIPEAVSRAYARFVRSALSDCSGGELRLSPEAMTLLARFNRDTERRLKGDLEPLADWGGKLVGTAARIAALFHCARHGSAAADVSVDAESVSAACGIADVLSEHAKSAYGTSGFSSLYSGATDLLRRLVSGGRLAYTKTQLYALYGGRINAERLDKLLDVLVERSYVRVERGAHNKTEVWLNPLLFVNPG